MSPILFKRLSDESLGSRLASGEAAAFDELYRRYIHRLAAYGSHLLGDAAAGEDIAQATLLKAYGVLRDGRLPSKMRPWLFRIAHNAAIDLVVRRRELPSDDLPDRAGNETEPMAGALVTALASLPDRQRRVYVLREVHGMRIDETAAELGLTTAQVEQSLFVARNRLAELLVFGDRLTCVSVRRLAAGPLDGDERRALKTHLRSCVECRRAFGVRARVLWLPGSSLEWLRGLVVSGAAPAAAKVGAVVATASIAAGVPVAVATTQHHRRVAPKAPHAGRAAPVSRPQVVSFRRVGVSTLRAPRVVTATRAEHHAEQSTTTSHDAGESNTEAIAAPHSGDHRSGDQRDGGGHDGGGGDLTAAAAAPPTTSTTSGSGDGGDGGESGGSTSTTPMVSAPAPLPAPTTTTVETVPPPATTTTTTTTTPATPTSGEDTSGGGD